MDLKILGLIPARSGSKGVLNKNIRLLGERPLIAHTIKTAHDVGCLDRVIVSTDSDVIADIARRNRGEVPWLRPPELATDEASMVDVVIHALERLATDDGYHPDAVMVLQPTSPFRSVATVRTAVEIFRRFPGDSVVGVSPASEHPYWCKRVREDGSLENWDRDAQVPARRQDLPPAYCLNGALYLACVSTLKNCRSLCSEHTRALVVPEEQALDIDTEWDWALAECMWPKLHRAG